jgi:carbon storage regulator CsrA
MMLVLTRKQNEKIIIERGSERIEIVLCEITNLARVRIGVHASAKWRIFREEVECKPTR